MGALSAAAVRFVLSGLYFLASIATSVIVPRRLGVVEYGAYSIAARRLSGFVRSLYGLVAYWYIRVGGAASVAEYAASALILLPLMAAAAFVFLLFSRVEPGLAAVYAVYAGVAGFTLSLLQVYVSHRYVRSEALRVAYRGLFALLVFLLLYMLRLGSLGLLAAQLAAASAVVYIVVREVGLGRPSFEWLRWERIRVPLLAVTAAAMVGLDVVVASHIAGPAAIAIYSISVIAPMIVVELFSQAFSHMLHYLVSTGDRETVIRGYRVALLLAAPLWGYMAARPRLVLSVFGAGYARVAHPYLVIAALILAPLVLTAIYSMTYASGFGRETSESPRLRRLQAYNLGVQLGRLASIPLVLTLVTPRDPVLGLIAVQIGVHIASLIPALLTSDAHRVARWVPASIAVAIGTSAYTRLLLGDFVARRFWQAATPLLEGLPVLAPVYAVLLLLDRDARLMARRVLERLTPPTGQVETDGEDTL